MSTKVVMPQMGESVTEGTITKWLKAPGDAIRKDEPLLEISTDKVDSEIPAPADGFLTEVLHQEGEKVPVDTVIAVIGAAPGAASPRPAAVSSAGNGNAKSAVSAHSTAPSPAMAARVASASRALDPGERLRLSPVVRRIADEHGVDVRTVAGTGSEGRVTKRDILQFLENGAPAAAATARPAAAAVAPPVGPMAIQPFAVPMGDGDRREPMSTMRRAIADHMVRSKHISPHVASVWEVDMSTIAEIRVRNRSQFEKQHGFKLTYTPFLIRAMVMAVKQNPLVNTQIDGTDIIWKRDINVGMAVAIDDGLIVPVIRGAGDLNFTGIARQGNDLALRARDRKLTPQDVQGGTITITNPGIFGSLYGVPVINQPQVAILCVGAIQKRVVVLENDAIAVRPMAYLALSFDHRVIDGASADRFMGDLKKVVESWTEPVL